MSFLWEKWEKHRLSFLWGFWLFIDINAQGSFFSQIARLVEMNVCANFEKNRRGPPIDQNFSIAYNFFLYNFFEFFRRYYVWLRVLRVLSTADLEIGFPLFPKEKISIEIFPSHMVARMSVECRLGRMSANFRYMDAFSYLAIDLEKTCLGQCIWPLCTQLGICRGN